MNSETLSVRQLSVAVLVGGLSHAAAFSGGADWRWALAAIPPGVLLGWLLLRRVGDKPLYGGAGGKVFAVLYCGWAVVLMSAVLHRAAQRVQIINASRGDRVWILILITLPLLWLSWGKAAAFFRAVEIFWLAVLVLVTAVLLFALLQIQWEWLITPLGDWRQSGAAAVLSLGTGLFILPYIYKVDGRMQSLGWLAGLGLIGALLAVVTTGVLSTAVAGQLKEPFFVASGVLGESVRGEGLISTLWLLPDLTLAGLLSRVWGDKYRPVIAVAAAFVLALTGLSAGFSLTFLAVGTLLLAAATLLLPAGKGKIVVSFW